MSLPSTDRTINIKYLSVYFSPLLLCCYHCTWRGPKLLKLSCVVVLCWSFCIGEYIFLLFGLKLSPAVTRLLLSEMTVSEATFMKLKAPLGWWLRLTLSLMICLVYLNTCASEDGDRESLHGVWGKQGCILYKRVNLQLYIVYSVVHCSV